MVALTEVMNGRQGRIYKEKRQQKGKERRKERKGKWGQLWKPMTAPYHKVASAPTHTGQCPEYQSRNSPGIHSTTFYKLSQEKLVFKIV
jgi:hypothetical protein